MLLVVVGGVGKSKSRVSQVAAPGLCDREGRIIETGTRHNNKHILVALSEYMWGNSEAVV